MKKKLVCGSIVLLCALLCVSFTALAAQGYEKRTVGKYTFLVGFMEVPAYKDAKNGLSLTICDGTECKYTVKDGSSVLSNPVEGAEKNLKAEVTTGNTSPLTLPIESHESNPGKYTSYFLPSTTGAYTFHIFGNIDNQKIDEKFSSSPNTFGDVQSINQYPPQQASSAAQSKESATNAINIASLQSQVKDVEDTANSARTMGIAGTVAGLLGLLTGGIALLRRPRPTVYSNDFADSDAPIDSLRG
ncbi:hypothetical protein KDA_22390 [Dictyobacter alpinus]|uniref:YtkA-like domain-containing protein n=1 Tax=Dictyobacter alpinus TaxID=2014873 RepID=A0A402B5Z0_9CHLR|nr:hypothetical protein [Dictyobacter alpinus]GCE26755.1 hypothetical protein KDA_22390 [Dictyobacter alpinus]